MADSRNEAVPRHLGVLFGVGAVAGWTDGQLLDRFVTGDGGSTDLTFAALVERHGPMVLRVCGKVLADPHDAQDAFQATFLILAQRAGTIRRRESVGSWLHGVAVRVARVARAAAARRRAHEQRAAALISTTHASSSFDLTDLGPALHEELERIPEQYRAPLVLCYLEGLTHEQAAEHLRWPVGTVRSRLARGRERLRGRLVRRGLAPLVGALGLLTAESASASVPIGLVDVTVRAVSQFTRWGSASGTTSGAAAALARGVLRDMFVTHLRMIATLVLLFGTLVVGTGAAIRRSIEADDPPARTIVSKPPAMPINEVLAAAARAVESDSDGVSRVYALIEIANAQTRAGDLKAARATAVQASNAAHALKPKPRCSAVLSVAWARAGAGDRKGGLDDLRQAVDVAAEDGSVVSRLSLWKLIAAAQADLGDRDAATTTIQFMRGAAFALQRQSEKISAWGNLVSTQTYVGDYEGAFLTVDAVGDGDDYLKGCLLGNIASTAAAPTIWYLQPRKTFTSEERTSRLKVVRRVVKAVEPFKFAEEKHTIDLSIALAHLGGFDEALRLARRYDKEPFERPRPPDHLSTMPYVLSVIAGELGKSGRREEASQLLREAHELVARDPTLANSCFFIAHGHAEAGDLAAAFSTTEALDPTLRPRLLIEIAEAFEKAGDLEGALKTYRRALQKIQQLEDEPARGEPAPAAKAAPSSVEIAVRTRLNYLDQIATIQARLGDLPAAMESFAAIKSEEIRGRVALAIAEARARAGDAAGALNWALTLEPRTTRVLALRGLGKGVLAAKGRATP